MNIEITGRHVKITPQIEEYARSKAERVAKFVRSEARIEVILDQVHDKYQVEMIVSGIRGPVIIGHTEHDQANAAIDLVIDKVDHQLRKLRDRKKSHHGESMAGDGQSRMMDEGSGLFGGEGEASVDDVVRED